MPHDFSVVRQVEEVDAFLSAAALVSGRTWQAKRVGVRVRDDADQRRWFARGCATGRAASLCAQLPGESIAFAIGTQWNGCFSVEEIGYDLKHAASC